MSFNFHFHHSLSLPYSLSSYQFAYFLAHLYSLFHFSSLTLLNYHLSVMDTRNDRNHEKLMLNEEQPERTCSPAAPAPLSGYATRTIAFWRPLLVIITLLLLTSFLVKPVVVAAKVSAENNEYTPDSTHTSTPSSEQPTAQTLAIYLATTVLGWLGQTLYYVLRPFYLAIYWVIYITILLPGQIFYSVYVAIAPVIGFLLVAAGVGVCVGGGAAWSVQTAAEMGWGDVNGISATLKSAKKNDLLEDVDKREDVDVHAEDTMSVYSLSQSNMDDTDDMIAMKSGGTAKYGQHQAAMPSSLRRRYTAASDFSNFSDWGDENEEGEGEELDEDEYEEEEDEPLSNEEDPARLFDAILERDKKRKEEMKLGKVPADYVLWQQEQQQRRADAVLSSSTVVDTTNKAGSSKDV
ncbi:hypothetical protein BDF22DRAFT_692238 [Syncephalis plumigaleata]|nr:hypothetical protein BDF22DRAFT_692238 [Syncephalis plumigaleata]